MAQVHEVRLVDDLDGKPAHETIAFGLDGTRYEIDLSAANADTLRNILADYVAAARRVSTGPRRSSGPVTSAARTGRAARGGAAERERNRAIRAWALRRGLQVAERGRIPSQVAEAYHRENS